MLETSVRVDVHQQIRMESLLLFVHDINWFKKGCPNQVLPAFAFADAAAPDPLANLPLASKRNRLCELASLRPAEDERGVSPSRIVDNCLPRPMPAAPTPVAPAPAPRGAAPPPAAPPAC